MNKMFIIFSLLKFFIERFNMKGSVSLGGFLWKLSVALYLIVNGVMALTQKVRSDFYIMFHRMFNGNNPENFLVIAAGIIALIAGIAILLEMFNIEISFFDTLIFIIAIIWGVYVIVEIITWLREGFNLPALQVLAVHLMVLSSLLIASKRFGD